MAHPGRLAQRMSHIAPPHKPVLENKIVEWRIENFSYWRERVHGEFIITPTSAVLEKFGFTMRLFPRGGPNGRLVVCPRDPPDLFGDLSLLGGADDDDGIPFCTLRISTTDPNFADEGPAFEEVVARIKDRRLVLLLQFHSEERFSRNVLTTTLAAWEAKVKIEPAKFADPRRFHAPFPKPLFHFKEVWLRGDFKDGTVDLALDPIFKSSADPVMVETSLSTSGASEVRSEHLFVDKTPWTFATSLKIEDGGAIFLRLTVIKDDSTHRLDYDVLDYRGVSVELSDEKEPIQPADSVAVLAKDLSSIFYDTEFADVTLQCVDETFRAHKVILSARSPVLKEMLSSHQGEAPVRLKGMDPDALLQFLSFLYTGCMKGPTIDIALSLYVVSDEFRVPTLKRPCVDHLRANLSVTNVSDVLSFADMAGDQGLVDACVDFVASHRDRVLESPEWKSLLEKDPEKGEKFKLLIDQRKTVG